MFRIESDRARFREIVRGRIRKDLRKYLSTGELIGRAGRPPVVDPDAADRAAALRLRREPEGRRPGRGREGRGRPAVEARGGGRGRRRGRATRRAATSSRSRSTRRAGRDARRRARAAQHPAARQGELGHRKGGRYNGVRHLGPDSLRHFRRTYRERAEAHHRRGPLRPGANPRVVPVRRTSASGSRKSLPRARLLRGHLPHDGRLRLDGPRAEGDRPHQGLLDRHLAAQPVQEPRGRLHRPRRGGARRRPAHLLPPARVRRHEDLLGLRAVPQADLDERYRPEDWNIYPFHYSDGDNWSARDTERCISMLRDELLPRVNQFCYGQVKSAHGSGPVQEGPRRRPRRRGDRSSPRASTTGRTSRKSIRAFLGSRGAGGERSVRRSRRGPSSPRPCKYEAVIIEAAAARGRPRLLRGRLRAARRQGRQRRRGLRRLPGALSRPGASGWSTSALEKGLPLGPLEDLRAGHQQRPDCYAYLVRSNSLLEQKLVMAHVYGHADFFKNNLWFAPTDRKMLDTMGESLRRGSGATSTCSGWSGRAVPGPLHCRSTRWSIPTCPCASTASPSDRGPQCLHAGRPNAHRRSLDALYMPCHHRPSGDRAAEPELEADAAETRGGDAADLRHPGVHRGARAARGLAARHPPHRPARRRTTSRPSG